MKFRRNPAWEPEFRRSPGLLNELHGQAEEVKRRAVAIAPRGPTGMYHRSLKVVTRANVPFTGRLAEIAGDAAGMSTHVYVTTTDFAGHLVEYGSANNRVYAVIRRAVRASGLRLHEIPKP